jgi:hypothetical protein
MLQYRVLYYPDFSPDSMWLRRVLMLTDEVIRIVPSDVKPDDSEDVLRLQDVIPQCLTSVPPHPADAAIEPGEQPRLKRAFELLRKRHTQKSREITLIIGPDGNMSVLGHVFLHESKLSDFVMRELKRNNLLMDPFPQEGSRYIPVRRAASELILAGLASRMARRLGVDAITDDPTSFAFGALQGVPRHALDDGAAEGALLSAMAKLLIPASVSRISARRYQEIRNSYASIREAFKAITAELAARHRLGRVDNPEEFVSRVDSVSSAFASEYRAYRKSRYARRFRTWTPLCVGGLLSIPTAFVFPLTAAGLTTACVVFQVLDKCLGGVETSANRRVFNMLAGLRRDLIERSGVRQLV